MLIWSWCVPESWCWFQPWLCQDRCGRGQPWARRAASLTSPSSKIYSIFSHLHIFRRKANSTDYFVRPSRSPLSECRSSDYFSSIQSDEQSYRHINQTNKWDKCIVGVRLVCVCLSFQERESERARERERERERECE